MSRPASSVLLTAVRGTRAQTKATIQSFQPPLQSRVFSKSATVSADSDLSRLLTREWREGDVYAPHDLSAAEMRKWRKKQRPTTDAFDALSLDPLSLYKNFSVMSEYMTEMGRIRHSKSTGLRAVNQRKISKAIRRAIALGLMPSVHRHPEILKNEIGYARQLGGSGRY